jgi:hypothetical protein
MNILDKYIYKSMKRCVVFNIILLEYDIFILDILGFQIDIFTIGLIFF